MQWCELGACEGMLPLRLRRVSGLEARVNDVLFQPAARPPPGDKPAALVFFGGDVQDYPEVMEAHRDNRNYVRWNLENTARMLATNFPEQHIVVVRPSRVEFKSFSCYDNFVPSNNAGVPEHTPTHSALLHLERLLQDASSRIKALPTSELLEAVTATTLPEDIDIEELHNASIHHCMEHGRGAAPGGHTPSWERESRESRQSLEPLWWRDALALHRAALTLVGFSKGCVVLNQFIYEFHYTKTLTPGDDHMMRLIDRIEAMYWLDGGHAGGKNTWITARSLLETLARLDVNIYVHVSPYQVLDEARPWIGREEKIFTSLLGQLGAKVSRYLHGCGGAPHSLHTHFHVLQHFHLPRHHTSPHGRHSRDSATRRHSTTTTTTNTTTNTATSSNNTPVANNTTAASNTPVANNTTAANNTTVANNTTAPNNTTLANNTTAPNNTTTANNTTIANNTTVDNNTTDTKRERDDA